MLSKILLKILSEAIIPAVAVFLAKILSALVLLHFYSVEFSFAASQIVIASRANFLAVNSYSDLFALAIITLAAAAVLFRAHFFHKTHLSPWLGHKAVSDNLEGLAVASWDIYPQSIVWLALSWLATFFFALEALLSTVYGWLPFLAALSAVNTTWLLIFDLEREIEVEKERQKDDVQLLVEEEV